MKHMICATIFITTSVFSFDIGPFLQNYASSIVIGSVAVGYMVFNEQRHQKDQQQIKHLDVLSKKTEHVSQRLQRAEEKLSCMQQESPTCHTCASCTPELTEHKTSWFESLIQFVTKPESATDKTEKEPSQEL